MPNETDTFLPIKSPAITAFFAFVIKNTSY
nr:MAG TPA: hypothetical protein [Caudoviricetes sp.]